MNNKKLILIMALAITLTAIAGIFIGRSMSTGVSAGGEDHAEEEDHSEEEGLVRLTEYWRLFPVRLMPKLLPRAASRRLRRGRRF